MRRLLTEQVYHTLTKKAYLYDTGIQPIVNQYEHQIAIRDTIILGLLCVLIIGILCYWFKSEQCKYYRQVLKDNVGGW